MGGEKNRFQWQILGLIFALSKCDLAILKYFKAGETIKLELTEMEY